MGFCMALNMKSIGIPGRFWGNAGFSGKFGVWGGFGRFGASKGFCTNSQMQKKKLQDCSCMNWKELNGGGLTAQMI